MLKHGLKPFARDACERASFCAGIETVGKERFKIVNIRQEKPVLVCEVELLDEEDDTKASAILLRPCYQFSGIHHVFHIHDGKSLLYPCTPESEAMCPMRAAGRGG